MSRIRWAVGATAALALLVTAACGSDTDEGGTTETSVSTPTSVPTDAAETPEQSSSEAPTDDYTCIGKSGDQVPDKLVLALVPSADANKLVETAKPLTDYLTTALGVPVEGKVSTNYAAAVEAMGADQAQIGLFAPLPMIQSCQKYGAKIVLQSVRYGLPTYHTEFFTNNPDKFCTISAPEPKPDNDQYLNCNGTGGTSTTESKVGPMGLEALKNLTEGDKVALLDPGSTSGYIFPMLALINSGIEDPNSFLDIAPLQAHDQSVLAVYNGDVEVGVAWDDARDDVVKDKPDVGQKVVVFAYSDEIPNDGAVVSGKLTAEWQDKITKVLQDFSNSEEGKKVLGDIYGIDSLAPADPTSLGKVSEAVAKLGLEG